MAERRFAPQTVDHLKLFFDQIDTAGWFGKLETERFVLGLEPARPDAKLGSAIAQLVQRGGHLGEDNWMSEGDRTHQGPEADALRIACQGGKVDPRVG